MRVGQHARRVRIGRRPRAVVRADVNGIRVNRLPSRSALVPDQHQRRQVNRRHRIVWTQRLVGQVLAHRLVLVARQTAHAYLHRPRRAREIRDARTGRPRLRRAGWIRQATLIAFLLTDAGQDLPRQLVARTHLLIDPQEGSGDVAGRCRRRGVADPAARARAANHDRQQRGAPREQQRKRGCYDHDGPDAAPTGHDRHGQSALLHAAHQPAAGLFLNRQPQPKRRDPSVLDDRRRDDEPRGCSERGQRNDQRVAAALGGRGLSALIDQLTAQPGRHGLHRPSASSAVDERQIGEEEPRSDDAGRVQPGGRHRWAHRRRQRTSRRRTRRSRRDWCAPPNTAVGPLERQRRYRAGKAQQQQRRRGDDPPPRT